MSRRMALGAHLSKILHILRTKMDSVATAEFVTGWQIGFSSVTEFLPILIVTSVALWVTRKIFDV